MLTETGTLARVMDALDEFPHLDSIERAHIWHAIDTAPEHHAGYDNRSEYARAWRIACGISLGHLPNNGGPNIETVTLAMASGYNHEPTVTEVIAALYRASGMRA